MASLCHPWFTTTNLSYRFPILKLPPPPCAVLLVNIHNIFRDILDPWFFSIYPRLLWTPYPPPRCGRHIGARKATRQPCHIAINRDHWVNGWIIETHPWPVNTGLSQIALLENRECFEGPANQYWLEEIQCHAKYEKATAWDQGVQNRHP